MLSYLLRRLLYLFPILIGVNLITFLLFFLVNPPQDQARQALGGRNVRPEQIAAWMRERGYDRPRFWNAKEAGLKKATETIFFEKNARLFLLDFGRSDVDAHPVRTELVRRIGPSLMVTLPAMALGLLLHLALALAFARFKGARAERGIDAALVALMSISGLFYIIGIQALLGKGWMWIPVSGWADGLDAWRFVIGPVLISLVAGTGASVRFYRALFEEELGRDYVRTARAKGLPESRVLSLHVLRSSLVPIATAVVAGLPFLVMGSLLLESFFAIPGLGNYTLDALNQKDFAIVRAMVFFGSLLTILGLLLTDFAYLLVDPRIRLGGKKAGRLLPVWLFVVGATLVLAIVGHLSDPAIRAVQAAAPLAAAAPATPALWPGNLGAALALAALILLPLLLMRTLEGQRLKATLASSRLAQGCLAVVLFFIAIAWLDSVRWREIVKDSAGKVVLDPRTAEPARAQQATSLLDAGLLSAWRLAGAPVAKIADLSEKTYSAPFAKTLFVNTTDPSTGERRKETLKHPGRHPMGTDKAGSDVFLRAVKGVRTAVLIGILTTLLALPFALLLGVAAGWYGGWVDDLVQYLYTLISAIPGVLLVMAFVLLFGQGLWQICVVLGLTGWTDLCRLMRGETLKLRELPFIASARALGARDARILRCHVIPNLTYLVLVNLALAFSALVLAEATLSYLGIGVDPGTGSWGVMINDARLELSRDPVVAWPLLAAFASMFALLLPANLLADQIRGALDPKSGSKP
ncbi:MAG: ABC transporter permease subunit [Spirochaetes bacterium]|nr:ABC transporter permease subunit [Spirochaetota bacterium]